MAENPWTPGPWTAEYSTAKAAWTVLHRPAPGAYIGVAQSLSPDNARLIALAPEMAELLDEIATVAEPEDLLDTTRLALERRARELVARARGET